MQDHYNIAIVGAGLVGTCLAISLASLPLRVVLIEASSIIPESSVSERGVRPLALTYGSACILEKIGVWATLQFQATPIHTVHISDRGHFGIARIKAKEEGVPALGYVVPSSILSGELNKALLALIGKNSNFLTRLNGASVQALEFQGQSWRISLAALQETLTIQADLVVAADGTRSTVRQLLGITTQTHDYEQSAIATTFTLSRNHGYVAYERFTETGAIAMLPLSGTQCGCIWTVSNTQLAKLMSLTDSEFLQHVQHNFGYRLGKLLQMDTRHTYPLKMVYAEEQVRPGLVLIGNAAHTLHPIAAQGFNLGLQDVVLLAQVIANGLQAGKSLSDLNLLNDYIDARRFDQKWIMKFTNRLVCLFAHDFLPLNLARSSGLLALDFFPFLKRRLAKRLMGILNVF